jgi:hypothetical protein
VKISEFSVISDVEPKETTTGADDEIPPTRDVPEHLDKIPAADVQLLKKVILADPEASLLAIAVEEFDDPSLVYAEYVRGAPE